MLAFRTEVSSKSGVKIWIFLKHSARKESLGVGLGLPNGSIAEVY